MIRFHFVKLHIRVAQADLMETKTELEQWLERLEAMGGPKGFLRATRNNQD